MEEAPWNKDIPMFNNDKEESDEPDQILPLDEQPDKIELRR